MAEYIEREKLIEHLKKDPLFDLVERYGITGVIEAAPAADVREVVRASWGNPNPYTAQCTNCGMLFWKGYPANFCPNCGTDMRET